MGITHESYLGNRYENPLFDSGVHLCDSGGADLCLPLCQRSPGNAEIGVWDFLSGQLWRPANNIFGILPMIMGSIYVTGGGNCRGSSHRIVYRCVYGSLLPETIYGICKTAVNLMAGVPSVVYGFFGLVCIVPLMRDITGRDGSTMLTASILLGIMILPTIVSVCEASIRSVPVPYYEGALALGATKERSIFATVLRRRNPVSWPALCWGSDALSARPWRWLW